MRATQVEPHGLTNERDDGLFLALETRHVATFVSCESSSGAIALVTIEEGQCAELQTHRQMIVVKDASLSDNLIVKR
jgi:hypothetical protein